MKNLLLTVLIVALLATISFSQNDMMVEDQVTDNGSKISLGVHLGASQSGTDTHSWGRHGESPFSKANLVYGLNAKYNFSNAFGLRLNWFETKIAGDDKKLNGPCKNSVGGESVGGNCHTERGWNYSSPLREISLELEWQIFSRDRYVVNNEGKLRFRPTISPYITGGIAMAWVNPVIDYTESPPPADAVAQDLANMKSSYFQIPLGAGLRFDLTPKVFLDAEVRGVLPTTDLLDGMSATTHGNNSTVVNDSYNFGLLRLGFRLGGDSDSDGDGVFDKADECPEISGLVSMKGCPDADADGIRDGRDDCPNVAGISQFNGCPDSDGDGIKDMDDACPNVAGMSKFDGCPDSDGDGIVDGNDDCPNTFGEAAYNGCMPPDADGDGVSDANDLCPNLAGDSKYSGCPDTDGDGIADNMDKCPDEAAADTKDGCPLAKSLDLNAAPVLLTCEKIYFNTNQSSVGNNSTDRLLDTKENIAILDRAIAKVNENANFRVVVKGHTDSRGSETNNQKLSERRANEVMKKLIAKGAIASKVSAIGLGETAPLADESTKAGMAENRCVEVCIYDK